MQICIKGRKAYNVNREDFFVGLTMFVLLLPNCIGGVTVNESQMKIPAERGQDFVWRVEQRNKKGLP